MTDQREPEAIRNRYDECHGMDAEDVHLWAHDGEEGIARRAIDNAACVRFADDAGSE